MWHGSIRERSRGYIFCHMKVLHFVAFSLLVVGGINWLLVGLVGWDIGQLFGGMGSMVSRAIYILVGLAAIWEVATHKKNCRYCGASSGPAM